MQNFYDRDKSNVYPEETVRTAEEPKNDPFKTVPMSSQRYYNGSNQSSKDNSKPKVRTFSQIAGSDDNDSKQNKYYAGNNLEMLGGENDQSERQDGFTERFIKSIKKYLVIFLNSVFKSFIINF